MTERGRVIAFTVQYEPFVEGGFMPAERYDTAHGRAHRDSLDWTGRTIAKHWLSAEMDFNTAYTYAEQDIKANWHAYRDAFIRWK